MLENKLLQKLGDEMFVIISIAVQSTILSFIKFLHLGRSVSFGICYHNCTEIPYFVSFTLI